MSLINKEKLPLSLGQTNDLTQLRCNVVHISRTGKFHSGQRGGELWKTPEA